MSLEVVWAQEQSFWTWTKYRSIGNVFCIIRKKLLENAFKPAFESYITRLLRKVSKPKF